MQKVLSIVFVVLLQACAFTDAQLQVTHDTEANVVGPISELEAFSFSAPMLEDMRLDKERIGWKKNGYGAHTADITTERPVQDIVADAVTEALSDNGHAVTEQGPITITGTVDRFWFETDVNFWTIEFTGDIQCTLNFVDSLTDSVIYSAVYSGTHKKETGGGLTKTWMEVLGKAVDNLIEEIVFDEELSEALESFRN